MNFHLKCCTDFGLKIDAVNRISKILGCFDCCAGNIVDTILFNIFITTEKNLSKKSKILLKIVFFRLPDSNDTPLRDTIFSKFNRSQNLLIKYICGKFQVEEI